MAKILVIGGTGFLGTAVCKELKGDVYTYSREKGGQHHIQGGLLKIEELAAAMKGKDIVINLVGLTPLREPQYTSYRLVHVQGVKNIIEACKQQGIKHLIHVSALGASIHAPTAYLKTKGKAELLLEESNLQLTILRPSLIIDTKNELVQQAIATAPFMLFPNIKAKTQPILREDVAKLIAIATEGKIKEQKLDVVGEDVMTIYELVEKIRKKTKKPCYPLPLFIAQLGLTILAKLHLFGYTLDQVRLLTLDNTSESEKMLRYLKPQSIDAWLTKTELDNTNQIKKKP